MSDTATQTAEQTTERKPPTLADIVREKTDDGRRIIDFFLDVMEDRIDGAELCHRMDAAKQLEKHKSKAAAKFLAKYRGVSCGHSTGGRPDPADPCSAEERSLVAVTLNAPATLTQDFLTVLSGIDEFLMARLIRAQTADGGTIIDFLDDVMQDRNDGFKTHHRIAAAKELIVHIVRDEQPESVPAEAPASVSAEAPSSVRAEPVLSTVEGPEAAEGKSASVHPEPNSTPTPREPAPAKAGVPAPTAVVPAEAGTHPRREPAEGPQDKARRPRRRLTRKQRRQAGAARAALLGKGSERKKEERPEKPAPAELTIAERRINEKLEQHWHEPNPWAGPIDSTTPGRSPPW